MQSRRRSLTLLLLLALLIVCVAILIPVAVSASGTPANSGEIEDFSYQTLTGADVKNDTDTDLRFLFSIGNLDYDAVGFVFSKSDDPVKTDSPKPNYKETTKVYRSVTANGEENPAPNGRFWVAVKLSDIPHASFATYVYIRPYVEDGEGVRYGETKRINVCEALGHVHEIKNPTGTATLLNSGTRCGYCAACDIDGIVEQDVRAAVNVSLSQEKFLKGSSDLDTFDHYADVYSALSGNQKFYPDVVDNGGEGRDFFFQIDMLWNETMLNCIQNKCILCFYTDKETPLFYFTPNAYADRYGKINGTITNDKGDNPWSGGFDWTNGLATLEGPAGGVGCLFDRYPNLNNSGDEQDWGWHRIGVRVHQDAATDGETVTYSGVFYLYIDGVQRWKVSLNTSELKTRNALLFTRDADGTYHANNNGNVFTFWATHLDESTSEVQMVTANLTTSAVIPSQFSAGVVPVSNPVDSKFVLKNDQVVSAKVWFMAEHEHVWDGESVVTREATVLQPGKRADHCKLCGAENPNGEAVAFVPQVDVSISGTFGAGDAVTGVGLYKTLEEIRGNEHFYAKNGHSAKNLYFEYSILWNETLENWDDATEKSEMKVIQFFSGSNHKELFYLYSRDGMSGDCPFAGHFDYSCYKSDDLGKDNAYDLSGEGITFRGSPVGQYVAGWGESPKQRSYSPYISDSENDLMYGWHHIGVLVHQEAAKGSGTKVSYSGWSELYIDGVKVWKVKTDVSTLASKGISLFKATNDGTKLTYSDTNPTVRCGMDRFASSGDPAYAIFGDARWRIVDTDFDPSTEIEPVASPASVDYVIPGTDVQVEGAVYFRAK